MTGGVQHSKNIKSSSIKDECVNDEEQIDVQNDNSFHESRVLGFIKILSVSYSSEYYFTTLKAVLSWIFENAVYADQFTLTVLCKIF